MNVFIINPFIRLIIMEPSSVVSNTAFLRFEVIQRIKSKIECNLAYRIQDLAQSSIHDQRFNAI